MPPEGKFSGPEHIHGVAMPGLAELRKAKPGDIQITYQDIPSGGRVRYSTSNRFLVAAHLIHRRTRNRPT